MDKEIKLGPQPPRGRFHLSLPWMLILAALVVVVEIWAEVARDPDIWLPDPWHGVVIYLVVVFLLTAFISRPALRVNLRLLLAVIPVLVVLGMETWLKSRDVDMLQARIEVSDNPLLRYHYRPGAPGGARDEPPVNPLGLRDDPHPIPKPPGTWRVVLLGDSVPNDGKLLFRERFHSLLEDRLSEAAPGHTIEVVNVSCEGYNTLQEVELYAEVGRQYEPDLVLLTYVVNDPFLQNGAYRRLGNSFFLFQVEPMLRSWLGMSDCGLYWPMHQGYGFQFAVGEPMRRLKALAELDGVPVVVAALPLVTDFDDPICGAIYDKVGALAKQLGFDFLPVVDAFRKEPAETYLKADNPMDKTHPNAAGHQKMAAYLAEHLEDRLPAAPAGERPVPESTGEE